MLGSCARSWLPLGLAVAIAAGFSACGGDADVAHGGSAGSSADASTDGTTPTIDGSSLDVTAPDSSGQGFDVQPNAAQTITVQLGASTPTVPFVATLNGNPTPVAWSLDRGDLGSVTLGTASTGVFTPSGKVAGTAKITAGLNGQTITREVNVLLTGEQNGADPSEPSQAAQIADDVADLTVGGGVGGVGGEGLGQPVTDAALLALLGAPTDNGVSQNLRFLYPYDQTVFPRGILAPLIAWD